MTSLPTEIAAFPHHLLSHSRIPLALRNMYFSDIQLQNTSTCVVCLGIEDSSRDSEQGSGTDHLRPMGTKFPRRNLAA